MSSFIDNEFYRLIADIESKSEDEIYLHMVNKFLELPFLTQISIQQFLNKFEYWGRVEVENMNFEMIRDKAKVFHERSNEYVWLYEHLQDYRSKYILFSVLNNFYNFDFVNLRNCMENIYKHYFDLDIMPRRTDEVLVDIGAYIGDSCIDYIESYGKESYKKIYCYEISDENIEKMRENLRNYENICILKKAVSDFNGELHFDNNADSSANKTAEKGSETVNAVTLDDDLTETISVVKMDIEGGEISALKGMKNHIKKDRPTLLISVYHNNTDLLDIPKLIADYNKDYQYYLRYYGGCYFATEIVLIAIPAKREER